MEKLIRYLLIFVVAAGFLSSCEKKESNFASMSKDYDPSNPTYYVQLTNSEGSYQTAIDDAGLPKDIVRKVNVVLMGAPQASDITVTLSKNSASTIADNMWKLSASSVTIPAGENSASFTMTALASEMVEDASVKLILDMDAGASGASSGTQASFTLKRIKFCAWAAADMVGDYSGSDMVGYGPSKAEGVSFSVALVDDTHITISGLGQALYSGEWGEAVSGGDAVEFTVNPNGTMSMENQYLCQTDGVWDYYIGPAKSTIKWDGCNFKISIPWMWHWDDGYADNYPSESVLTKK